MTQTEQADRRAATDADLHPLLAARWSPRGFDRTHVLDDSDLATLLEAARWAPSSSNSQPWRFLVTRRGEPAFDRLHAQLAEGNQGWTPAASALLIAAATVVDEKGDPLPWARYDTGQAAAHLSIQASAMNLVVHQMAGFDPAGITAQFALPAGVEPVTALAIGRWDPQAPLPDYLQEREFAPRERRPLTDLVLPS